MNNDSIFGHFGKPAAALVPYFLLAWKLAGISISPLSILEDAPFSSFCGPSILGSFGEWKFWTQSADRRREFWPSFADFFPE